MFNGKMRKLVLTAARNGYYFTLDRVTGERLVTSKYGHADELGEGPEQVRRPAARSRKGCDGRRFAGVADLGRHHQLGAAGLLSGYRACSIRAEGNGYSIFYLTDVDPRGSMGLGGKEEVGVGAAEAI